MPPALPPMTLVSHHLCPYVQRVAIALAERGIAHERLTIDLAIKPAWFAALSPLGKVPLLKVGDAVLFESQVICEYLEDVLEQKLHPADPLVRARHRAWIEVGSAILGDVWGFETARDADTAAGKAAALRAKFERLEAALGDGPFFAGTRFSLVDAAVGPVFRYFDVFEALGQTAILADLPKLAAWRAALAARPSVRDAAVSDYPVRLRAFLAAHDAWVLRPAA